MRGPRGCLTLYITSRGNWRTRRWWIRKRGNSHRTAPYLVVRIPRPRLRARARAKRFVETRRFIIRPRTCAIMCMVGELNCPYCTSTRLRSQMRRKSRTKKFPRVAFPAHHTIPQFSHCANISAGAAANCLTTPPHNSRGHAPGTLPFLPLKTSQGAARQPAMGPPKAQICPLKVKWATPCLPTRRAAPLPPPLSRSSSLAYARHGHHATLFELACVYAAVSDGTASARAWPIRRFFLSTNRRFGRNCQAVLSLHKF